MNPPGRANRSEGSLSRRAWAIRLAVFVGICSLAAFVDLYSKSRVFEALGYPGGQSRAIVDSWVTFRFYTSFNRGALWGIGQNLTWLFAGLSMLAALVILYWLFVRQAAKNWLLTICLALIMAGTLGNLYDRLGWHGCRDPITNEPIFAVRDFLLFTFGDFNWPVFNFADVFLVAGAACLILQSLFGGSALNESQ